MCAASATQGKVVWAPKRLPNVDPWGFYAVGSARRSDSTSRRSPSAGFMSTSCVRSSSQRARTASTDERTRIFFSTPGNVVIASTLLGVPAVISVLSYRVRLTEVPYELFGQAEAERILSSRGPVAHALISTAS